MKSLLIVLLAAMPFLLNAQTKPGKFRIESGLFTMKYEIGDTSKTRPQVYDHLQVHDTDAAYYFQRAHNHDVSALITAVMGTGGILVGVVSKDSAVKVMGYGVAVAAYSVSLGFTLASSSNTRKARDHYNIKFGYN